MGAKETAGFMQAVAQTKPFGYSLYAFGQTTPAVWRALARSVRSGIRGPLRAFLGL